MNRLFLSSSQREGGNLDGPEHGDIRSESSAGDSNSMNILLNEIASEIKAHPITAKLIDHAYKTLAAEFVPEVEGHLKTCLKCRSTVATYARIRDQDEAWLENNRKWFSIVSVLDRLRGHARQLSDRDLDFWGFNTALVEATGMGPQLNDILDSVGFQPECEQEELEFVWNQFADLLKLEPYLAEKIWARTVHNLKGMAEIIPDGEFAASRNRTPWECDRAVQYSKALAFGLAWIIVAVSQPITQL